MPACFPSNCWHPRLCWTSHRDSTQTESQSPTKSTRPFIRIPNTGVKKPSFDLLCSSPFQSLVEAFANTNKLKVTSKKQTRDFAWSICAGIIQNWPWICWRAYTTPVILFHLPSTPAKCVILVHSLEKGVRHVYLQIGHSISETEKQTSSINY